MRPPAGPAAVAVAVAGLHAAKGRVTAVSPVAAIFLLAALSLGAAAPAAAQESRYTRSVTVAEPGWVGVPLPQETVQRAGGGLRVLGPGGEEIAARRVPLPGRAGELPAQVVEVVPIAPTAPGVLAPIAGGREGADRWAIVLDLGPAPPRHDRLLLGVDRLPADPGVRIDTSTDGEGWELLALADLRPVAAAGADAAIVYPATAARFLRLWWPRGAGAPEVEAAAARPVPAGAYELAATRPDCRPPGAAAGGTARVCRLGLGAFGRLLRRLDLDVESPGPIGYRLLEAADGGWRPVAEGIVPHPGEEDRRLAVLDLSDASLEAAEGGPGGSAPLRLVLHGAGDQAPTLLATTAVFEAEGVVFGAPAAGRYTLVYGAGAASAEGREAPPEPPSTPPVEEVRWLEPGPETADPVAPGAAPALLPAPEVAFAARFPVGSATAAPGDLVRLPLAAEIYGRAAPDLADLRLLAGDAQVPYALWRSPEPVPVTSRAEISPGVDRRFALDLPAPDLPLSALALAAAGPRFETRVRLLALMTGDREPEVLVDWTPWSCRTRPPLPCRLELGLAEPFGAVGAGADPRSPVRALAVEVEDDEPSEIDAALWRRRDVLLYFQPAGDEPPLVLAAGAPLEAPTYELAARLGELLERPWQLAQLQVGPDPMVVRRLGRAALGLALAAAVVLLLVLLDRMLRRRGA